MDAQDALIYWKKVLHDCENDNFEEVAAVIRRAKKEIAELEEVTKEDHKITSSDKIQKMCGAIQEWDHYYYDDSCKCNHTAKEAIELTEMICWGLDKLSYAEQQEVFTREKGCLEMLESITIFKNHIKQQIQ